MIIEVLKPLKHILNTCVNCGLLVAGWSAVMMTTMVLLEPTQSALVIVKDYKILERLPDHVRFTKTGPNTLILRSDSPGFVSSIYTAGGLIVFPALANGCLDLRSA